MLRENHTKKKKCVSTTQQYSTAIHGGILDERNKNYKHPRDISLN